MTEEAGVPGRVAEIMRGEPGFMAHLLSVFVETRAPETTDLGAVLGCRPEMLDALALCRAPREERFSDDVTAVAEYVGCDAGRLASLIREAQAVAALANNDYAALPMAARDRLGDDHDEEGED